MRKISKMRDKTSKKVASEKCGFSLAQSSLISRARMKTGYPKIGLLIPSSLLRSRRVSTCTLHVTMHLNGALGILSDDTCSWEIRLLD